MVEATLQGFVSTDFNRDRLCCLSVTLADHGNLSRRRGIVDAFLDGRQLFQVAGPEKAVHLQHRLRLIVSVNHYYQLGLRSRRCLLEMLVFDEPFGLVAKLFPVAHVNGMKVPTLLHVVRSRFGLDCKVRIGPA